MLVIRDLRIRVTHLPSRKTGFLQDRIDRSPFFLEPLDRKAGPAGIDHAGVRHRCPPDRAISQSVAGVRFQLGRVAKRQSTTLASSIKELARNLNEGLGFETSCNRLLGRSS